MTSIDYDKLCRYNVISRVTTKRAVQIHTLKNAIHKQKQNSLKRLSYPMVRQEKEQGNEKQTGKKVKMKKFTDLIQQYLC